MTDATTTSPNDQLRTPVAAEPRSTNDQLHTPVAAEPRSTNVQLFADYGDAWASHDADSIAAFHADDGIFHLHAAAGEVRGRDAIRDAFAGFLAQFPDLEFVEQESWIENWGWVVRWRMSGTLAQPFDTGSGTAEPGGRMEIDALDVITVSDGRLTAKHTYVDWATALAQMGIEG